MQLATTLLALASAATIVSAANGWTVQLGTGDCASVSTVYRQTGDGSVGCTSIFGSNATGNNLIFAGNTGAHTISVYTGSGCTASNLLVSASSSIQIPNINFDSSKKIASFSIKAN